MALYKSGCKKRVLLQFKFEVEIMELIMGITHLMITLVYYFVRVKTKKNTTKALVEAVLVFCIPGYGLIFMLIMNIAPDPSEDPSYMYKDFRDERLLLREFNLQEADILPVHDVLLLADAGTKRELLLEVIKRNVLQSNELLFKATRDSDREISHYAVSMVTSKLQTLETAMYELEKELAKYPDDIISLKQYADVIGNYLKIGFLDNNSELMRKKTYAQVLATILSLDQTEKKFFIDKINCEISLQNYDEAEKFCALFLKNFNDHEEPYLQYIKLYYFRREYEKINQYIAKLKATNIKFSNQALNIVRFWDESLEVVR